MTGVLDETGVVVRDPDDSLATGDLGFLDDQGELHVVGRADDVIITGGENVHPGPVEDALAGFPGVRAAVVFAVPDPRWGQRVAAAIVCDRLDRAALVAHLTAALAPHQRPRCVAVLAALPLGPTGKVDRRAAAALAIPTLVDL
jgi:acyl-CoA synthetase (AMP-forming)/AMP-acid ligase II